MKSRATVSRSITIRAPLAEVWRAMVHPDIAPRWMGMRMQCSWELGSPIELSETPLGPGYSERGTLRAFEPERRLGYDHWSPLWRVPDTAENYALLTIELEVQGEATRVTLTHQLPDVEALPQHSNHFWGVSLAQLRMMLEPEAS